MDITKKSKPPTQMAGVTGIDAHGSMGAAPIAPQQEQQINFNVLVNLPAFEMFVFEESGQSVGTSASEWIANRRSTMGDSKLYELYAIWHEQKGLWVNENPMGQLK